jgi:hypothetical protein
VSCSLLVAGELWHADRRQERTDALGRVNLPPAGVAAAGVAAASRPVVALHRGVA